MQICPWQARATPRLGRQDRSALQGQAWNRWVIGWWFDMDYLWIIYGLSPWLFGLPMDYDNIWINYDIYILLGGLEHDWIMTFHSVGNVITPTDELHHFSEGQVYHQPDMI